MPYGRQGHYRSPAPIGEDITKLPKIVYIGWSIVFYAFFALCINFILIEINIQIFWVTFSTLIMLIIAGLTMVHVYKLVNKKKNHPQSKQKKKPDK